MRMGDKEEFRDPVDMIVRKEEVNAHETPRNIRVDEFTETLIKNQKQPLAGLHFTGNDKAQVDLGPEVT